MQLFLLILIALMVASMWLRGNDTKQQRDAYKPDYSIIWFMLRCLVIGVCILAFNLWLESKHFLR